MLFDTFAQTHNFIKNTMGDLALGELGKGKVTAIASKDGYDVGVHIEAGAVGGDVVSDNEIGVLLFELLPGVFLHALGLAIVR